MTVKQTSWEAYQDITRGGVAKTQAQKVFQTLQFTPGATRNELASHMNLPINAVCGRVKELLDSEVIYVSGVGTCSVSGRNVEQLKVVSYV